MDPAPIRFLVDTTEHYWGKMSLAFVKSMDFAELSFKCVSWNGPVVFTRKSDPWFEFKEHFTGKCEPRVNIVCGVGTDPNPMGGGASIFSSRRAADLINIAITGPEPRAFQKFEIDELNKFDEVWIPNWTLLNRLDKGQLFNLKANVVNQQDFQLIREILNRWTSQ